MTTRRTIIQFGLVGLAASGSSVLVYAQDVAARNTATPAILTMGQAGGVQRDMTLAELEKLPKAEIRTTTPWHDGVQHFEGVSLQILMETLKLSGSVAQVTALNRYRTTIPVQDFAEFKPILAYRRNGLAMEVREKGPLFIVYPYDSNAVLKSETYFSRSAWQVRSISVS